MRNAASSSYVAQLCFVTGIDVSIRQLPMKVEQIARTILVSIAFIVLIIPDQLVSINLRRIFQPKTATQPPDKALFVTCTGFRDDLLVGHPYFDSTGETSSPIKAIAD